jgi:hypothetical protein
MEKNAFSSLNSGVSEEDDIHAEPQRVQRPAKRPWTERGVTMETERCPTCGYPQQALGGRGGADCGGFPARF